MRALRLWNVWVVGLATFILMNAASGIASQLESSEPTEIAKKSNSSSILPPAAARLVDYATDIQPILGQNCYRCHGPEKQKNELRLDIKSHALKGGTSGRVIEPDDSARSLIVRYMAGVPEDKQMPPTGKLLTAEQIGLVRAWIDQGAVWPDGLDPKESDRRDHWSFKSIRRPNLPPVPHLDWVRNAVDRFILARLEAAQLSVSPEANRATLIRRLSFTLTGLPPTPEEVDTFVAASRVDAYEALVERLLASPRYGERWARHWLDVVRFAESHGFEMNGERPNAWPYRDYVIAAFNQDKPYNQFVLEQLAGDALGTDEATGFLVGGPFDTVKSPDINLTAQQRMDELHDMVATTSSAFLGLTVGCARWHNHKFDPILQTDYYAMQAIFAGVQHGERPVRSPDAAERMEKAKDERRIIATIKQQLTSYVPIARPEPKEGTKTTSPTRPPVHSRQNVDRIDPVRAKFLRFTILETSGGEPCLDELEVFNDEEPARNVALVSEGTVATASGTYAGSEFHKLAHINDGQVGNAHSWISDMPGKGWVQLEFDKPVRIARIEWARDREGQYADRVPIRYKIETSLGAGDWQVVASSWDRAPYKPGAEPELFLDLAGRDSNEAARIRALIAETSQHEAKLEGLTRSRMIYAGRFEQPGPTYRLNRGEALQKQEQVIPGSVRGLGSDLNLASNTPEQRRRLGLAQWLVDPQNPLTARVLVNRIWQHHFGQGLVSTPSDFGHMGATPTHPELLDWLASELVTSGWSIKHVQRLIVLSATYRQSSAAEPNALTADAGARLIWRYPPQRMEAEPIRDAILSVSGALDLRMGGRGFDLFDANNNYVKVYNPRSTFGPEEWRRMVYQAKPRMRLDDTFGAFDCPDAGQATPRRSASTTPLQALNLLNSPFLMQQAQLLAQRLKREAGEQLSDEVERAFRLAFCRIPTEKEKEMALQLASAQGLTALCRALFNANEFVYVF